MSDPVQTAMERFEVPAGYKKFLFCLPLFYVAKADGAIALKEVVSIAWNSVMQGLVAPQGEEKRAFDAFYKNKIYQFQGKADLGDFAVLADAIYTELAQYPAAEAQRIRDSIREACVNVAQSSGPLFRDKVSAEERQMLDKILGTVK